MEKRNRAVAVTILRFAAGVIIFLVLIFLVTLLADTLGNPMLLSITSFLNDNVVLILLTALLFFIADLFYYLDFPFHLPGPLFSAAGATLLTAFVFHLLWYIDSILGITAFAFLQDFLYPTQIVVFVIVLVYGYLSLFSAYRPKLAERHAFKKTRIKED